MVLTGRETGRNSFMTRSEAADMADEATDASVESVQLRNSGHWCAEAHEAFVRAVSNFVGKHDRTL